MSRAGITYEQVELAAEKILLEGFSPTIEKIRQALGGTGSNSTIAKYLNDWKSKRLTATRHDLPASNLAPDPVNAAVNRVWQQIREEAAKEIEAIKTQFSQEITILRNAADKLQKESGELTAAKLELQSKIAALSGEKELLAIDLRQCQQELAIALEREQGLKKQLEQAAVSISEFKTLQAQEIAANKAHAQQTAKDHAAFISELKYAQENERQRYMLLLDKSRTAEKEHHENQKILRNQLSEYQTKLETNQALHDKTMGELENALQREAILRVAISDVVNNNHQELYRLTNEIQKVRQTIEESQKEMLTEVIKQRTHRQVFEEKISTKLADLSKSWTKNICEEAS